MESKQMIIIAVVAVVAIGAIGGGIALALGGGSNGETTYTLTYNTNGGTAIDNKVFTKDTDTFDLASTTRSGYEFLGWYENENFTGSPITQIVKGTEKDVTVYAKWQLVLAVNVLPAASDIQNNSAVKVVVNSSADSKTIPNEVRDALTSGKTLTVEDTDTNLTWTFTGSDTKQDGYNNETFDTAVTATPDTENKKVTLSFDYEGTLPYQSTVRYLFGAQYAGQEVTAENSRTHEVIGPYPVDSQGYVEFPIDHCSDWTISVSLNVRFDPNGGTFNGDSTKVLVVPYKDAVGTLPVAKRIGYTFAGWSPAVTAETIVTDNVTYTATWTENQYQINFNKNSNDASGSMDHISVMYTGTQAIPECTFINRGYTAIWNTLSDGKGTVINAGGNITGQIAAETAVGDSLEITLFAQWVANTYTVTFDGNGGTVPATSASKDVVFKEAYGALPTANRNGYSITGWNTAANGSGTTVTAESLYEIADNSTLYAQWSLDTYSITYVIGDGATNSPGNPTSYNVTQSLEFEPATKEGKAFVGWFKDPGYTTGEVTSLAAGSSVGDLTLYAKWGNNNVKVSFTKDGSAMNVTGNVTINKDANSAVMTQTSNIGEYFYETSDAFAITNTTYTIKMGDKTVGTVEVNNGRGNGYVYFYTVSFVSDGVTLETRTVLKNETVSAPDDDPVKTGYSYTQWVSDAGSIWNFSNSVTGTMELRPLWNANTYTVTFVKGEGAGGSDSATATYDANIPNVTIPERDGFDFLGYFYNDVKYIDELGHGVKAWDRTIDTNLTAHWDVKKYRAVINSSGGQPVGTVGQGWENNGGLYVKQFEYGTAIASIITDFGATFSKDHYTFTGWDPSTGTLGTEGVTILPTFDPINYTVIFNTNGGSGTVASVPNIHYGSVLAKPAYDGTKAGFNNAGAWCYDDSGILNAVFTDGSMTVGDALLDHADEEHATVTLYAKWTSIDYTVVFNVNGGTGDAPANLINKHFDDVISFGTPAVTKESKFFGGWNTKADGSGTNYKRNATVDADFVQYAEGTTVTLYIKWVDSLYTATVGDVFSGHNYSYSSTGQQLSAQDWKAVVIWANAISYQVELLNYYNEEWISDGFVTLAQGRYPNLYMDADEGFAETMRSSGVKTSDQMTVSFNGENRTVDLDVYTLTTQYGTTIMAEDADGTCFYYRTSSGGGGSEFHDAKMAMEAIAEGEGNGYTPTVYSVSYLPTRYSDAPIVVSSQRYKDPAEIGMNVPDGKVFVGWMFTDKSYHGVEDNDRLFNSSQIITCPHELYAIFTDLVLEPTNIDWEVHNKPAGITLTIDGNDAYESNGANGKYVVFSGGTDWYKEEVSAGQYRYTFVVDDTIYHLQMKKSNGSGVSEAPDGNVMRILFGVPDFEQYDITLYFWMDMPIMKGYLPVVNDAFTYLYSVFGYEQNKTFTVTSVDTDGSYTTANDGSFMPYYYPMDIGGVATYLQFDTGDNTTQYAGHYIWLTDSITFNEASVSCHVIKDMAYKRSTYNGEVTLNELTVAQGYYGLDDGLLYELRRNNTVTTLTSKPVDLHSVSQYQVVLNGNGGLFDGEPTITLDYAFTLDDESPSYADREFVKWNTLANGAGRDYVDGDRFNPADLVDGRIVLYAQWILDGFYVNVTAEGATPDPLLIERPVSSLSYLSATYYPYDFSVITPPSGKAACAIGFLGSQFDSVNIKRNNYSMHDNGDGTYSHSSDNGYSKVPSKEVYYRSGGIEGMMWLDVIALSGETVDLSLVWTTDVTPVTFHSNFDPDATTVINYPSRYGQDGYFPAADLFTRENYAFLGWGVAADSDPNDCYPAGNMYDTSAPHEFWAIWEMSMTVTYNASGGNGTIQDQTILLGNNVLSNGNGLSKDGFVLVGWATTQNSTTLAYPLSGKYVMEESQAGTTLNLYAVWATGTYTVRFNLARSGGFDYEGEMANQVIGVGISTPLSPVGYREPTGFYVFGYWTPTEDGGTPHYEDGEYVLDLAGDGETITLNTWWIATKYYIQYELNPPYGSELEGDAYRQIAPLDEAFSLNPCQFLGDEDYSFNGWNTQANGQGTSYVNGATIANNLTQGGDTIQLFAQWRSMKYTVQFSLNAPRSPEEGSDIGGEMDPVVLTRDVPASLPASGFSDSSHYYTFMGWNTAADGSGTSYADEEEVENLAVEGTKLIALFAQWERTTYTLVFYKGEGASGHMDPQDRTVGDGLALPACTFTAPEGMVFDQWEVNYGDDNIECFPALYEGDLTYVHGSAPKVTALWVEPEP